MTAVKQKDAFKSLRRFVIIMAVLALIAAALTVLLKRQINYTYDKMVADTDAMNKQATEQYNQAVAEFNEQHRQVQEALVRPVPAESGWDVIDVTGFDLASPTTVTVARQDVLSGGMLLLNRWHSIPADFPESAIVAVVSTNSTIPVSGSGVKMFPVAIDAVAEMLKAASDEGLDNYLLDGGYRTLQEQTTLYQEEEAKYSTRYSGEALIEQVTKNVNYPGTSEYESGLSFRISRWRSNDAAFNGEKFDTTPHSDWLVANSWKYGIVFRFPVYGYPNDTVTDKSFKTGETKKLRIYRYVGKANAAVMHTLDFCMEEYIEYLMAHPHIEVYEDGVKRYEILRVEGGAAAEDAVVQVSSTAQSYSVSYDNMNGLIITMTY